MQDPTLTPLQVEQQQSAKTDLNPWQRLRANLGYWWYKRNRETNDMLAFLVARKNFRPTAKFSIVVPYFANKFLHVIEFVASLEAQRYKNWELCICNDGDPDPTVWEYFENLKKIWGDRLKLTRNSVNKGTSAATRSALALATGDFVVFAGVEDLFHKEALRLMAYRLAESPACNFVYADHDHFTDYGRRVRPVRKPAWSPELLLNLDYIHYPIAARRALVLKHDDFFPEELAGAQNYDFTLKMAERAGEAAHLPFVVYHWRGAKAAEFDSKPWALEAFQKARAQYVERMRAGLRFDSRAGLVFDGSPNVFEVSVSGEEAPVREKIATLLSALKVSSSALVRLVVEGMRPLAGDLDTLAPYASVPGVGAAFPFLRPGLRTALMPTKRDRKFVLVTKARSDFSCFTGNVLTAPIHGLTAKRDALIEALEELNSDLNYIDESVSADSLGAAIGLQFLKLSLRNVSVAGVYCDRVLGAVQAPQELDSESDPFI